jgi:hypothetical protein
MVKVINTKDRVYNWVKKGWIIDIPEEKVFEYKIAWFSTIEEKNNIVKSEVFEWIDENLTIAQLKEKLDHLWIKYDECKLKSDFQKLLSEALQKPQELWENKWSEIDELKEKLISEKIVESSELEGKNDDEIKQIATDNWLI